MRKLLKTLILLGVSVISAPSAQAYDWFVEAKIVLIEPNYMPDFVPFQINQAGGSCAAGSFLTYTAQGATASDKQANIQAVVAALLTAQSRNQTVRIYGNNTGCAVTNMWMIN